MLIYFDEFMTKNYEMKSNNNYKLYSAFNKLTQK